MTSPRYIKRLDTWVPADDRFTERWNIGKGKKGKGFGTEQMAQDILHRWGDKSMKHMLDIGSFVGWCARFWSKKARRVTAWEPNPISRSCAERNLETLQNVTLKGDALFEISKSSFLNFNVPKHYGNCTISDSGFPIHCTTLDSYNFTDVDFIKLDTEGTELNILKGGRKTITANKPLIQIEINEMCHKHGHTEEQVHDYLKNLGMKMVMHDNLWDYVYEF